MRISRLVFWVYIGMAAWLLLAGAHRITSNLGTGTFQWSPIVSTAIGLLALVIAIPIADEARIRRRGRPR